VFLREIFKQYRYKNWQIHRVLNRRPHLDQLDSKPNSVTFLPFVGTIFNCISTVLAQHNIKSVELPHKKLSSLLHLVKDHLRLRTPGVHTIPCEFGRVYIGQRGRSMDIRIKGHQWHIQLEHLNKSAVAEHSIDHGHCIQFHSFLFSPRKPDIWTALLGRPLKLNSTLTISTERVAFVSVNHGSLLSAP
jgi:hypothetical protein